MRLAIITTHPIQYYARVFELLQQYPELDVNVFYTWGKNGMEKFDPGFEKVIKWDIPLLDGYNYEWVEKISINPNSSALKMVVNPKLINQVARWKPDAILVFGWAHMSHLKIIRYFKGKIPVLFRGDSTLLDTSHWLKEKLRELFLNWVYGHVDYAFYTGTNNFNYYKKFGMKDNQLSFAPHAVDNARFARDKCTEANQLRENLGLNCDNILIVFAGKFEEKKDLLLLLRAFLKLKSINTHLLFVGNGTLRDDLLTKAKNPNVHFLDFQNQTQMPIIYQAADLFCLPSKGPAETWGLAVNEAMACGKAVLVSDKVGCAVDLVKSGINGYIFKAGSLIELHYYLSKLTASKKDLQTLGKHSAEIIKDWNFTKIAEAIKSQLIDNSLQI